MARTAYTVTLDFAALWETTNALVIRRRSIEDLVRQTRDPQTLRILAVTLGHLVDAERKMRAALDIEDEAVVPHFDNWTESELREAFGR